jgi:hypothetical protein
LAGEHDSQTAYEAAGRIASERGMPTYVVRDEALAEAKKVIRAARSTVDAIAAALLAPETLSGDELRLVVASLGN